MGTPLLVRVREYYAMSAIESRARALSTDDKSGLLTELRRVRERRVGAEALWASGCPAQAYRLVIEAFGLALSLARRAAGLDTEAGVASVGAALSLEPDAIDQIDRAQAATVRPLPLDDLAVTAEHVRAFRDLRATTEHLERAAAPSAMSPPEVARARLGRRLRSVAIAGAVLLAAIVVFRGVRRTRVEVSATYSDRFEAPRVIDGNRDTDWLLPDGQLGWLDVRMGWPRKLKTLHLSNAHNLQYLDHGTKDFAVEVWSKDKLVKTVDGHFGELAFKTPWVDVDISSDARIDRLRIVIKSFYGAGGGLAELSFD